MLTAGERFYGHRKGEMVFVLAYSGSVGTMLLEGDIDFASAYSGLVGTMTIVGGVLPDGTQRIGEEGDSRSGAASSLLPYPPRPPTPSPLTGLVCACSHILIQVEGWKKGFMQLKGREKSSLAYSGFQNNL